MCRSSFQADRLPEFHEAENAKGNGMADMPNEAARILKAADEVPA